MLVHIEINKEDFKHTMGEAIGHLICWGISHYSELEIYSDICDNDYALSLIGVFKKENGEHGYTIGAIWDGSKYTYHS